MTSIFDYPVLSTYAVLAYSGITSVNTTTITNGNYGSSPTQSYINISGSVDSGNAGTAQTQLTALVGSINSYRSFLPSQSLAIETINITLNPNINYNGSGITFQGISITLDGQGNNNAQFFITSTSFITFDNISSITLINGARNCNIFWLAGTAITFTGTNPPSIPGIFIAGSAITFANASQISGRLYAQTENVTFSGTSSVNALCTPIPPIPPIPPISDICFMKNTPIQTDQGIILIQNIDHTLHTINKESIVAITKTISLNKYLICFEKDSLSDNFPNKQTIMSKNHKIYFKGAMIEARCFINNNNIYKIEYNNEILYNILMKKHRAVKVNNLVCETLDPENITAKIYRNNSDNTVIKKINDIMLKNNYQKDKVHRLKQINKI